MMPSIGPSRYPRARENRLRPNHPGIIKARIAFLKAAGLNFLLLQLLFLGLFAYIFGSLFQQTSHTHNLGIVLVDYDGGAIGRAIRAAYASLQGRSFPSLIERTPSDFPSTGELWEAVCQTQYSAALYVNRGASARLEAALASEGTAASPYNTTDVMAYIWNEVLYPPVIDSAISGNIQLLSDAARVAYTTGDGTGDIRSVSGRQALSVLAQPWQLQSVNIQPTSQGSRAIYNSVAIILVLIQEFFYLGTINGLYAQSKLYARLDPHRIAAVRTLTSLAYTFVGSLCVTGAIWAFRAGWNVNANQFALSWAVLWLFAHANFLTLDVFTIWLPPGYVPMALISWIILNVTSILLPFELSPAFYRVGYALPAHEVYQVLTHVWSRGCNPQLRYALPVLFAWELVSLGLSVLGVFRRCHFATVGEERQAREFEERLDAAVALEMAKVREARKHAHVGSEEGKGMKAGGREENGGDGGVGTHAGEEEDNDEEAFREQLADVIERVNTRQRQEEEKAGVPCSFGPSFDLPFSHRSDDETD
ncbi:hypothetical protein C8A00DRAFT_46763 [Chaetomidium leptoderma]|uniref:DUF3533 domain-containing protein n=1 Tax=Chaetomidium leptoderma TaxID=669021 RepID=A0AAN6VEK6_9PEZI|nr:hypothetical protein C8A00DRAFT_46763 [Chaetomidium leptoderma]